jgi:hypothetical protein
MEKHDIGQSFHANIRTVRSDSTKLSPNKPSIPYHNRMSHFISQCVITLRERLPLVLINIDYNTGLMKSKTQFDEMVGEWRSTDWVEVVCY